jgi:Protein of unknown function (DUF4087)
MITAARPALVTLAALFLFALPIMRTLADDLPDGVQGTWAIDSDCDVTSKTIDIIGNTLAMGAGAPAEVSYETNDAPNGDDAIHFTDEGDVSNFEYDADDDLLIYHAEGYGMGQGVTYHPCGDGDQSTVYASPSGDTATNEAGGTPAPEAAAQTRCGWLTELSEGGTDLIDGDGSWILEKAGRPVADGLDNVPDLTDMPHVLTGDGYGYACVCMRVHLGKGDVGIAEIDSVKPKPIRQCKADPTLSDPSTW